MEPAAGVKRRRSEGPGDARAEEEADEEQAAEAPPEAAPEAPELKQEPQPDANGNAPMAGENGRASPSLPAAPEPPDPAADGAAAAAAGREASEEPPLDLDALSAPTEAPLISARAGAFSQRELFFQEQEAAGAFAFRYVCNDGRAEHSLWLLALKNIFSRQLPNMPKEYITRLVFDRRHRSVAVVRADGSVIGGITYRPFHAQGFGEIAFCAVSASDQVKGFGARLMSYTKEYAKERDGLSHFLTYADNNAVTFFAKQDFSATVTLDRSRWVGYIKDYDGGTLMESVLHPRLPYTRLPQMIRAQRRAVDGKLRQLSRAHWTYPGLDGGRWEAGGAGPLEPGDIPGVREAGWTPPPPPAFQLLIDGHVTPVSHASLHALGFEGVAALRAHEDSPAFCNPVRAEEVPDYYDIIKDPMDLSRIEARLASGGFYVTLELLQADVKRIFRNAQLYNAADTYWFKAAARLEAFWGQWLAQRLLPAA